MTGPGGADPGATHRRGTVTAGIGAVPWDTGALQPALQRLVADGGLRGPVLDSGCGAGELSFALAEAGHEVLGVDIGPTAVAAARAEAGRRGLDARFDVADLTRLRESPTRFATVVDSVPLRGLDDAMAAEHARGLAELAVPGARLWVLAFDDRVRLPGVHGRSRERLAEVVGGAWSVDEVTASSISFLAPDGVGAEFGRDPSGHLLLPAWLLSARRGG